MHLLHALLILTVAMRAQEILRDQDQECYVGSKQQFCLLAPSLFPALSV